MDMPSALVLDTNVWLDYVFGNRPQHDHAQALITEATAQEAPLVVPSHSIRDLFFLVQQQLKSANRADGRQASRAVAASARAFAWATIDLVMDLALVGPSDIGDAHVASKFRSVHNDYEDNLVIATAMHVGARMLVTNDATLIRHAPIVAMTPHDALLVLRVK